MVSDPDAVFQALADPTRRALLDRLNDDDGQTLTELCEGMEMTRQAVTKHLALLESANLVVTYWHGREKLHYLNAVPIHDISRRWIGGLRRRSLTALAALKRHLEEEAECPSRSSST